MKFLDQARIFVKAGDGGAGCVSFRRERCLEFGGPDGGNGGKGGDVIAWSDSQLNTLIDYRYQQHFLAQNGVAGQGRCKTGRSGEDRILRFPVGTQIFDELSGVLLVDLVAPNQKLTIAHGGRGGAGNTAFKSSTHQAPRVAMPGAVGQEMWILLKLKLLADVGLVGFPNAGKSTLLAQLTRAHPKIGDYPFTTLYPQLGLSRMGDHDVVLADLPGLVENAHSGYGLGHRFLGHVERCSRIVHMIDGTLDDPSTAWRIIRNELKAYQADLESKPEIIVLTKHDLVSDQKAQQSLSELKQLCPLSKVLWISSFTGEGLDELTRLIHAP